MLAENRHPLCENPPMDRVIIPITKACSELLWARYCFAHDFHPHKFTHSIVSTTISTFTSCLINLGGTGQSSNSIYWCCHLRPTLAALWGLKSSPKEINWGWPLPPYCNIQNKHQTTTFPLYKWRQPFRRLGILLQSITGIFGIYIQLHIYTADHGTWGKLKSVWAHKELPTLLEIVKWS